MNSFPIKNFFTHVFLDFGRRNDLASKNINRFKSVRTIWCFPVIHCLLINENGNEY